MVTFLSVLLREKRVKPLRINGKKNSLGVEKTPKRLDATERALGKKVMTLIQIHPLLAADLPRLVRKFKKEVACVVLVRLTYKGIQKYLEIWN